MRKTQGFCRRTATAARSVAAHFGLLLQRLDAEVASGTLTSDLDRTLAARWLAVLLACVVSVAVAQPAPANREPRTDARLLVQTRAGVTLEALDEVLRRYGVHRVAVIRQINVHVVEVPPDANAGAVALKLKVHPEIEFAEVDERVPPAVRSSTPAQE